MWCTIKRVGFGLLAFVLCCALLWTERTDRVNYTEISRRNHQETKYPSSNIKFIANGSTRKSINPGQKKNGPMCLDIPNAFVLVGARHKSDRLRQNNPELLKKTLKIYLSSLPRSEPATRAFSLALDRFSIRTSNLTTVFYRNLKERNAKTQNKQQQERKHKPKNRQPPPHGSVLNSIRVPKAGSSALSVTARALAGCHPDGYACCKYPGSRAGVCPKRNLYCDVIVGCVGHQPSYKGNEPIISAFREPSDRHLSGFFYGGPHSNVKGQDAPHPWESFEAFVKNPIYQNVLTKMLSTGSYSYVPYEPSEHTVRKAQQRICSMAWYKMAEKPIASSLLLYETGPFRRILPNPVVFDLIPWDSETITNTTRICTDNTKNNSSPSSMEATLRVNSNTEYGIFRTTTFKEKNGTQLVQQYNAPDVEVYHHAEKLFCARLLSNQDLIQDLRKQELALVEILSCENLLHHERFLTTNNNGQPDYNGLVQMLCDK